PRTVHPFPTRRSSDLEDLTGAFTVVTNGTEVERDDDEDDAQGGDSSSGSDNGSDSGSDDNGSNGGNSGSDNSRSGNAADLPRTGDRKSTRLNSSHVKI